MSIKYIELGKRAFTCVILICITLIVLALCSLSLYTVYKVAPSPEIGDNIELIQDKKLAYHEYIKKYMPLAKQEEKLYGIPAKITMAQALLESNAGRSKLAIKNNNHFGIKCFSKSCKKGHCSNFTDDSHKDFFRKYQSVEDSYREHSLFLLKGRYKHLLDLPKDDLESWTRGLQEAGYATDKKYSRKLLVLINQFRTRV